MAQKRCWQSPAATCNLSIFFFFIDVADQQAKCTLYASDFRRLATIAHWLVSNRMRGTKTTRARRLINHNLKCEKHCGARRPPKMRSVLLIKEFATSPTERGKNARVPFQVYLDCKAAQSMLNVCSLIYFLFFYVQ